MPQLPAPGRDRNAVPAVPRGPANPCATFHDFRRGPCDAVLNRLTR
ncbi:hypothetical protein [Nonomuraea candida]|nr:hypothetical protein [Nonomuraea candida]